MEPTKLIGTTELRADLKGILDRLHEQPVTVLSRSKPVAILIHPDQWQRLQDQLDDLDARLVVATREHDTQPWEEASEEISAALARDAKPPAAAS